MLPRTFDKRKASPVDSDFIDVKIAWSLFERERWSQCRLPCALAGRSIHPPDLTTLLVKPGNISRLQNLHKERELRPGRIQGT
jgi:hypothetical protein